MARSSCQSSFPLPGILARIAVLPGILVTCFAIGCVRDIRIAPPSLTDALRLETSLRTADLQSSGPLRGQFFLRNVAATPIDVCRVEPGVTIFAVTGQRRFPLIGYGAVTDGLLCFELRPGEAREYSEAFTWSATAGFDRLEGYIRVSTRRGDEVTVTFNPILSSP